MNKFLKGAAILAIAGLVVKIMGVFFRIPLTLWVGADGLSYYSSVYPIYSFILILSTAGFPVAISRMVSERIAVNNYAGADRVFRVAILFMAAIGLVTFSIVFFGATFIQDVILDHAGTKPSLRAIAPALFLVPVMSAYRGYFQGRQNMKPTALSQFVEQLFRVGAGLLLAYICLDKGNEKVSAAATFGCSIGALFGLIVMMLIHRASRNMIRYQIVKNREHYVYESTRDLIKKILGIAIPIAIGASVLPLVNAIDSMMVMRRLQTAGFTFVEAKALWGRLGGYCDSLIAMPQVFVLAISMSLVPAISSNHKLGKIDDMRENIKLALRSSMLIGMPCAAGIFALAHPILKLLYPSAERATEVLNAVPTLRVCCFLIALLSIITTSTGALQGIGKQMVPVKNIFIGAIFKVLITFILVGIPSINVNGGPVGSIVCYIIAGSLDLAALKKYAGVKINFGLTFIKPLISSVIMGLCSAGTYKVVFNALGSNSIATLSGILVGVVVYAILVLILRSITRDELLSLPKGDKIVRILDKIKIFNKLVK